MNFEVGDMVQVRSNPAYRVKWNAVRPGLVGTVISGARQSPLSSAGYWSLAHEVRFDGFSGWVAIPLLRKLQPPPDWNSLAYSEPRELETII